VNVGNIEALALIFGGWPSFHDAEVVSLRLHRGRSDDESPWLELNVHLFETGPETDADGFFVRRHETLAKIRFDSVEDVDLSGFNGQNVLFDLKIADPPSDGELCEVELQSSYGLGGSFRCGAITVIDVEPFDASRE
jgi:hypothetical protein